MFKKLLIKKKNKNLISSSKNIKYNDIIEDFYNVKQIIIPNTKINMTIEKKNNKIIIDDIYPFSCIYDKINIGDQIVGLNDITFNNKSLDEIKKIFKKRGDKNILKVIKKNDSI